jgi:hypothetical protein
VETGLIAEEKLQAGLGGKVLESSGNAVELVAARGLGIEGIVQHTRLNRPGTTETPVGGGHLLHHGVLYAIGWSEMVHVLAEHQLEVFAVLGDHDDAFGEETVAYGVVRGPALAPRGGGSARSGAIGPRRTYFSQ